MLTTQYAKAWPDRKVNAAGIGYTATDFNGLVIPVHGRQSVDV